MSEETEKVEHKPTHYNRPQLEAMAIDANEEMDIWARATGKSSGRLSVRVHRAATLMPRCSIVNVAASYLQLLDRTLPPIINHWEQWGMKRNVDFWVRRFPDSKWGLKLPYMSPETAEHCVFIRSSKYDLSVMRLVSQDRPGSSNGLSVDAIVGDERKLLDTDRLEQELMPTNRGNERYFRDCHLHHSTCFTTDMPTSQETMSILKVEERMDREAVALIKAYLIEIYKTKALIKKRGKAGAVLTSRLRNYEKQVNILRMGLTYFSKASALENIDALGEGFMNKMMKLKPFVFNTAILNLEPTGGELDFYPDLANRHFYLKNAINYGYVDGLSEGEFGKGKLNDCRKDADIEISRPLWAAPDFGGSFNCLNVGQLVGNRARFLNNLFVINPKRVRHLAEAFCKYYRYYYKRELVFAFDHTHIKSESVADENPVDEFIRVVEGEGWTVERDYLGLTPSYYTRFHLWNIGLTMANPLALIPEFNAENTKETRQSMEFTKIKLGYKSDEYAKDKKLEKDKDADQTEAPHLSDSADILYYAMSKRHLNGHQSTPEAFVLGG